MGPNIFLSLGIKKKFAAGASIEQHQNIRSSGLERIKVCATMPSLKAIAKDSKTMPAAPKKSVKQGQIHSTLSSEFVQDSDDEDEAADESSSEDEPVKKSSAPIFSKANGQNARPTVPVSKLNGKKTAPVVATPESSSSGSESQSDEASADEESSSEDNDDDEVDEEPSASGSSAPNVSKSTRYFIWQASIYTY